MINCLQFLGASAALASERARLRDRLIRMEYLAAETNLGPEDKEKFIRRRMNKAYCRLAKKTTKLIFMQFFLLLKVTQIN